MTNDTASTGSRLPAEVPWSGAQSGLGLKPDIQIAGLSDTGAIVDRPARSAKNDAAFDHGIIMEGQYQGEVHPEGDIPWL
jgi:hypothetical protein